MPLLWLVVGSYDNDGVEAELLSHRDVQDSPTGVAKLTRGAIEKVSLDIGAAL